MRLPPNFLDRIMLNKRSKYRPYLRNREHRKWFCERVPLSDHYEAVTLSMVEEVIGSYFAGRYFVEFNTKAKNFTILVYMENEDDVLALKMLDINAQTFA